MLSFEKVIYKFQQLDEYLGLLQIISKTPMENFLKDKMWSDLKSFESD